MAGTLYLQGTFRNRVSLLTLWEEVSTFGCFLVTRKLPVYTPFR